jgi:nitrogen regulatory protein PII
LINAMQTVPLKRVTIVAEAVLERHLTADLERLGARGWTVLEARGSGSRGVRADQVAGANVQIETLVQPATAERIVEHVARQYFDNYAVIVYVDTVEVVRGDKYA